MLGQNSMGKEKGLLEKLELIIPGFHGYKKKELLREDDRLIRNYVYMKLKEARDKVRELMLSALNGEIFIPVTKLDRIWKELDLAGSKIKNAPAGYAGLFDRIKVKEEELEELKKQDVMIVVMIEDLLSLINELPSNPSLVNQVALKVKDVISVIEQRNNMFKVETGL